MVPLKVYANECWHNSGFLQDCSYGNKEVADVHLLFHWQPREEDPNQFFGHYSFLVRGNDDEPADFMLPKTVPLSRFSADETARHCTLADAKAIETTHETNAKKAEQADAHGEATASQQAEQQRDASQQLSPKKQAELADAHGEAKASQQAEQQRDASQQLSPKKQAELADAHGEATASQQAEQQRDASQQLSPKKQAELADAHGEATASQQAEQQRDASQQLSPKKQAELADAHGEAKASQQAEQQRDASQQLSPKKQAELADAHGEAKASQQAEQQRDASQQLSPKKQAELADAHGEAKASQQAEQQRDASQQLSPKKQAELADAHGEAKASQQAEQQRDASQQLSPKKQAELADAHGEAKASQQAEQQRDASQQLSPKKQAELADAHGEAKASQQAEQQRDASQQLSPKKQAELADAHGEAKASQQAEQQTDASQQLSPKKQAELADAHGEAKASQQAEQQTDASQQLSPKKQAELADAHGEAKASQQAVQQTDASQQLSPKKRPKTATSHSEAGKQTETTIWGTFSQQHTTVASLKAFFDKNAYCTSNRSQSEKPKPESKQHADMDTSAANARKLFDPARYHGKLAALPEFPAPVSSEPSLRQVDVENFFNPDVYHGRQHVDCEQELQGAKPCKRTKRSESNPDEICMVVLMQPHVMNQILQEPLLDEKVVLLPWKIKRGISRVYLAEVGTGGRIVATSDIEITAVDNFAKLRSHPYFLSAPSALQTAWRTRVTKEKRNIYSWSFKSTTLLEEPLQLPLGSRGTHIAVAKSCMTVCKEIPVPEMRLKNTCKYFIQKLSQQDYIKLKETARILDGVVIRTASTCSGTDVCCNIMRETFQCINEEFSVTRLYITYTLSFSIKKYIYIYIQNMYIYIYIYMLLAFLLYIYI